MTPRPLGNAALYGGLLTLLLGAFLLALQVGPISIDLADAVRARGAARYSIDALILFDIRLPRALLALLIGATLGIAGAALQGLLRNPLAEPGIIGVSNGAALGAVIVFYYGFAGSTWFILPLGGLLGAFVAVTVLYLIAGQGRSIVSLILAGIAINAIGGALIALALNFAASPYAIQEIVFWLLGSVANRSVDDLYVALPFMLLGWGMMLYCGRFLNALTLGEETAASLGFDVDRQRFILILGVSAGVGAAVSVAGNIGFVGLVVPHLMRPFVGHEPRRLLPASALAGAVLLLAADSAVQGLSANGEIKLGVVTSLIGAPFFLFLILKSRNLST